VEKTGKSILGEIWRLSSNYHNSWFRICWQWHKTDISSIPDFWVVGHWDTLTSGYVRSQCHVNGAKCEYCFNTVPWQVYRRYTDAASPYKDLPVGVHQTVLKLDSSFVCQHQPALGHHPLHVDVAIDWSPSDVRPLTFMLENPLIDFRSNCNRAKTLDSLFILKSVRHDASQYGKATTKRCR